MGPAIAVMAKAPRPGLAKTRLIPALGPDGAARLARAFLIDSAAIARRAAAGTGGAAFLVVTPDDACGELASLTGLTALPQGEGDLGARMAAAAARLFARGHEAVLLLGTDTPTLPEGHPVAALSLLRPGGATAAFGPAGDGGYWAAALAAPAPALFAAIPWGGPGVLAETVKAAARAGITLAFAPPWDDIDEPADLATLADQLARTAEGAPATRVALAELGLGHGPPLPGQRPADDDHA